MNKYNVQTEKPVQINNSFFVIQIQDNILQQEEIFNSCYLKILDVLILHNNENVRKLAPLLAKCKHFFQKVKSLIKELEIRLRERDIMEKKYENKVKNHKLLENKVKVLQKEIKCLTERNHVHKRNNEYKENKYTISNTANFHLDKVVNTEIDLVLNENKRLRNENANLNIKNNTYDQEVKLLKQKVGEFKLENVMLNNKLNNIKNDNNKDKVNTQYISVNQKKNNNSQQMFKTYGSSYMNNSQKLLSNNINIDEPIRLIKFVGKNGQNAKMKTKDKKDVVAENDKSMSVNYQDSLFLFDLN